MTNSEKMLEALENQELEIAQDYFQKALTTDDDETLISLGQELEFLGFIENAQTIYERLLKQHPEYHELHLSLAQIAVDNGDIDKGFEELEAIPNDSPSYLAALVSMADLYQLLEIPEVSEAKLLEARKLAPDEPLVTFALAELYYSIGQYKKAVKEYATLNALEIQEQTGISIYERIGTSYLYDGHLEHGIEFLEAAYQQQAHPTDDLLYQLGFAYFQLKDYQKVIQYLEKLMEQNPEYEIAQYYLAQAYLQEERIAEADEMLKLGVKNNPYNALMYQ
ncbi:MAG: tetratricopeptide repeat protein, partial [Streptococcaceae bacterium]|nr:tetratricopeptide repeat protein [Streptococcaceae bacterium]